MTDMRHNEPLVSCLMVTRNRRDLAQRAVACFAAQTWRHRHLVIVDDGDEDYTPMLAPFIAAGHQISYHRMTPEPGVFLGALRNRAIELSPGDVCIQWDDDEWYHPDRVAIQVEHLGDGVAVALRWTLMEVTSSEHGQLVFRADSGIATPGTVLHRRDAARYPNLARGEDGVFLRDLRIAGSVRVLGHECSHLFVRCFHGTNTWDERHFLRRLHRRPVDWPSYANAVWLHRDVRRHRAFKLDEREVATVDAMVEFAAAGQPATAERPSA